MKECLSCHVSKPLAAFKAHKLTPDGRTAICMDCLRATPGLAGTPEFRNSPGQRKRLADNRRASSYGISPEQYEALLAYQGGKCAICGALGEELKKGLHLDHDHTTGMIRGLLCVGCNSGIGYFNDNVPRLQKAIEYILAPPFRIRKRISQPRATARCGTISGYTRHRRLGESACADCSQAWRAYWQQRKGTEVKPRSQSGCGTYGGYSAHYARGEQPCAACKAAAAAYMKDWAERKRG